MIPPSAKARLLTPIYYRGRPLEDKSVQAQHQPTAAKISKNETVASAFLLGLQYQEYEVRSAAEAMPEEKYAYRPAEGKLKNEKPEFGPAEVRTFAQQVKHVACSNLGFAAELDGKTPPPDCDKDGPSQAKTKKELLIYLRDSFAAIRVSLGAIDSKNMVDDHYGQMTLYLPENNVVLPARTERHVLRFPSAEIPVAHPFRGEAFLQPSRDALFGW